MKAAGDECFCFLEGADFGGDFCAFAPWAPRLFPARLWAIQLPSVAGRGGAFRPPRKTKKQDKKRPVRRRVLFLYSTGLLSFGLRGFFTTDIRGLLHHRATAIADLRRIEFGTGSFRGGRGSGRSAFSSRSCGSGERGAWSERTATVFRSRSCSGRDRSGRDRRDRSAFHRRSGGRSRGRNGFRSIVIEITARETVTTVAAAVATTVTAVATGLAHAIPAILMITAEAAVLTAVVAAVVITVISAGSHFLGADGVTERRLHIRRHFLDDRSTQHGDERIHFRENKNAENRHNKGDDERYDFYYH